MPCVTFLVVVVLFALKQIKTWTVHVKLCSRVGRCSVRCAIKQSYFLIFQQKMIHKKRLFVQLCSFRDYLITMLASFVFPIFIIWTLLYLVLICKRRILVEVIILPQIHWCLVCYCDLFELWLSFLGFIKILLLHRSISEADVRYWNWAPCCYR